MQTTRVLNRKDKGHITSTQVAGAVIQIINEWLHCYSTAKEASRDKRKTERMLSRQELKC